MTMTYHDHFEIYKNMNHYAVYQRHSVLQVNYTSKTNTLIEKETSFVATRGVWGEGIG